MSRHAELTSLRNSGFTPFGLSGVERRRDETFERTCAVQIWALASLRHSRGRTSPTQQPNFWIVANG